MTNNMVTLDRENQALKQDSFKELMAVCDWVSNSVILRLYKPENKAGTITVGGKAEHHIVSWIPKQKLRCYQLWLKPEGTFRLWGKEQGSRSQVFEDEVTSACGENKNWE